MANITEKEQLEAIRSSFGTQADNFESSAMNFTKQEFLDYTVKAMELNKNDTVLNYMLYQKMNPASADEQ